MSNSWEIATWRFEIISALLDPNLTEAQKRRIVRDWTKRAVKWPHSSEDKPIGKSTLFRWLQNYREKGFLGLMPKARKDKGLPRSDRSLPGGLRPGAALRTAPAIFDSADALP